MTAKMDLHKKTEVKEQLMEHLCAIIQQNELRKADKLEELLQQLQFQASEEELETERRREEEERERQRKEKEEGEEKRQSVVENPGERTEGKEIQENGEVVVQSSPDKEPKPGGETEKQEGTSLHQDCPPVTEPQRSDQDCKLPENSLQSMTEAPASAS